MKQNHFYKTFVIYLAGVVFSLIFSFQMYWITQNTHLENQLEQMEKYYLQLQTENQKILFNINKKQENSVSPEKPHGLKKIRIKNIPVIEFQ